jgi:hypothetical protein
MQRLEYKYNTLSKKIEVHLQMCSWNHFQKVFLKSSGITLHRNSCLDRLHFFIFGQWLFSFQWSLLWLQDKERKQQHIAGSNVRYVLIIARWQWWPLSFRLTKRKLVYEIASLVLVVQDSRWAEFSMPATAQDRPFVSCWQSYLPIFLILLWGWYSRPPLQDAVITIDQYQWTLPSWQILTKAVIDYSYFF